MPLSSSPLLLGDVFLVELVLLLSAGASAVVVVDVCFDLSLLLLSLVSETNVFLGVNNFIACLPFSGNALNNLLGINDAIVAFTCSRSPPDALDDARFRSG